MYKLTKDEYNHLLDNAIIATYKKATKASKNIINKGSIKCAKRPDIFDRIEINSTSNCFTTLVQLFQHPLYYQQQGCFHLFLSWTTSFVLPAAGGTSTYSYLGFGWFKICHSSIIRLISVILQKISRYFWIIIAVLLHYTPASQHLDLLHYFLGYYLLCLCSQWIVHNF